MNHKQQVSTFNCRSEFLHDLYFFVAYSLLKFANPSDSMVYNFVGAEKRSTNADVPGTVAEHVVTSTENGSQCNSGRRAMLLRPTSASACFACC